MRSILTRFCIIAERDVRAMCQGGITGFDVLDEEIDPAVLRVKVRTMRHEVHLRLNGAFAYDPDKDISDSAVLWHQSYRRHLHFHIHPATSSKCVAHNAPPTNSHRIATRVAVYSSFHSDVLYLRQHLEQFNKPNSGQVFRPGEKALCVRWKQMYGHGMNCVESYTMTSAA
jgi:hypothetical protein